MAFGVAMRPSQSRSTFAAPQCRSKFVFFMWIYAVFVGVFALCWRTAANTENIDY